MRSHRIIAAMTALSLSIIMLPVSGAAVEADAALNAEDVTLYVLGSAYSDYLTIPEDKPTEFQLSADDGEIVRCKIKSGSSVNVTSGGLVTPKSRTIYWNGGLGTSTPTGQEGETVEVRYETGDSVVTVFTADTTYDVNIHVLDYSVVYADKVIDDYLAANYNEDMDFEEKLDVITKMPATYNYSAYYSGYVGMIVSGGGDCWASSSLILRECEKVGISARIRNGNRDPGAGSGHKNVLATDGEKYYELEAGYGSDTLPRPYSVRRRSSLYCMKSTDDGYTVYQYDGIESDGTVLEFPAEFSGKPVVGIDADVFTNNNFITEVTLPENYASIGQYAFFACKALKKLTLPASLTTIEPGALTKSDQLEEIVISPENKSFAADGSTIYTADRSEIVHVGNVDEFTIPDTVTVIRDQAFRHNGKITSIKIPDSVQKIGEAAFHNTALENVEIGNGVTSIGAYCFAMDGNMKSIYIPPTVTEIGDYAIGYTKTNSKPEADFIIYGAPGSAAESYALDNEITFVPKGAEETLYGDANCDKQINIADAVLVMQVATNPDKYARGKSEFSISAQGEINGDVDGKKGLSNSDALLIQKYKLGLIDKF